MEYESFVVERKHFMKKFRPKLHAQAYLNHFEGKKSL